MKTYIVKLKGCDDNTIFDINLNEEELKLLKRIDELSHEHSRYSCMPTFDIKENTSYKYKINADGEKRFFEDIDDVIIEIECETSYEVDTHLTLKLTNMIKNETLTLREGFTIECIL